MSVKSASKWATRGSICGCAWSADTLAAVIRPRTSTRPSIFIVPNIRSYAPLSPARHGYGVTWTNFRLGRLRTSILRIVHLLPPKFSTQILYPKFIAGICYSKLITHLTTLIPMRLIPIQKFLPTICITFFLLPLLTMAFPAPLSAAQSTDQDQSQRPTLNRHPSSDPSATPPPNAPTPSPSSSGAPSQSPSPASTPAAQPSQPGASAESTAPSYPDLLPHYDYDSRSSLDMRETNVEKRGDVRVIELNYAGAEGNRVPAYLLIPPGKGGFAGIVYGHWLQKGSSLRDKDEFLEEALVMARAGAVCVLVDAPQARHDFVLEKDLADAMRQQSDASGHQVIDLRRAVDLLYLRADVDRKRIGYVGHGFDAHTGAILAGVETRIDSYVLMAG